MQAEILELFAEAQSDSKEFYRRVSRSIGDWHSRRENERRRYQQEKFIIKKLREKYPQPTVPSPLPCPYRCVCGRSFGDLKALRAHARHLIVRANGIHRAV